VVTVSRDGLTNSGAEFVTLIAISFDDWYRFNSVTLTFKVWLSRTSQAYANKPLVLTTPTSLTVTLSVTSTPNPSINEILSQSKTVFISALVNVITKLVLPPITALVMVITSEQECFLAKVL